MKKNEEPDVRQNTFSGDRQTLTQLYRGKELSGKGNKITEEGTHGGEGEPGAAMPNLIHLVKQTEST